MIIDWFVLLFIAYILIMTVLKEIASHRILEPYLRQVEPLGIRKGVVFFLVRSMTPSIMLLTAWLILQQGILGGISLAVIGTVSITLFSKLYMFIQQRGQHHSNSLKLLSFLVAIGNLIIETAILSYLFTRVFHLQSGAPLYIIGVLLYLFTTLGGFSALQKFSSNLLIIIFLSIGTLPIGYYLYGGMSTIFQSLSDNTHMLYPHYTFIVTICIGIPIFFSQLLHQFSYWDNQQTIKVERTKLILNIVTFCWSSIPLAFTAIILYFMSKFPTINSVKLVFETMVLQTPSVIMYLMFLTWLALTLISMSQSLHHATSLVIISFQPLMKKSDEYWIRFAYFSGFVILNVVIILNLVFIKDLTGLLKYDAIMLASFLVPSLFAILSVKSLRWRPVALAMGLFGFGCSLLTIYPIEPVLVIITSTLLFIWLVSIHFIQSDFSEYS